MRYNTLWFNNAIGYSMDFNEELEKTFLAEVTRDGQTIKCSFTIVKTYGLLQEYDSFLTFENKYLAEIVSNGSNTKEGSNMKSIKISANDTPMIWELKVNFGDFKITVHKIIFNSDFNISFEPMSHLKLSFDVLSDKTQDVITFEK